MNVILLKDLGEDCVDAVIITETSLTSEVQLAIEEMKENTVYPEWDDYVNCLPSDCVVYDRWGSLDTVYY